MINRLVRLFIQDCDNVTDPAVREKYGVLSGAVGIVLNLLLSAGKFFAGVVTGSIAITADAFNNLSDAGSSVVTLVGFKLAGQKADDGHPFGHGRAEYLAGLLVSLMILLVGLELGKTSIGKILHPEAVDFSPVSVAILAASILVKLWMGHFNRTLGKKLGSAAMAATAADSLSDVVATSAVLAGTLAGHFAHLSIDGWAGAVVAVFILKAGWGAAKDTINPLLGASPDPELVLLDIMLPVMDGWSVLKKIRENDKTPVIMLTAKGETQDKVAGLEGGADDYIVKPFEMKEVLARIHAVLRRFGGEEEGSGEKKLSFDKLVINLDSYELLVDGKRVDTPPKELELLYHLAASPNRVFTRNQLLDEVWGFDYFGDSRTVDVHIKRLREKLEGVSEQWSLKTVWGVGYKFEVVSGA